MRFPTVKYLFCGFYGLLFIWNAATAQEYQFVKEKVFTNQASQYSFVDDLDNNAYSEIITVRKTGKTTDWEIQIEDPETQYILHLEPVWGRILGINAFDFNDDGKKEIIYSYEKEDSLYIKIYQPQEKGKTLLHEKFYQVKRRFANRVWDGKILFANFADLNHDGYSDIILILQAYYDRYPRGIIVYDFYNRRILWETPLANSIHRVWVKDLNQDGKWELYLDTAAPGNGTRINGFDDFHSYFIILDEKGKILFKKVMGGENSGTVPFFIYNEDSDREQIYTATFTTNMQEYRDDRFIKWTWKIWPQLIPKVVNEKFRFNNFPVVLPHEGIPHFFVSNTEGQLCMLDTTLRVVKIFSTREGFTYFLGSFDLNGDGKKEHVWRSTPTQSIVLDDNFKTIAQIPNASAIFEIEQGRGRSPALIMLQHNGNFFRFSLKRIPSLEKIFKNRWLVGGMGLILLNILFWMWLTSRVGNWKWYRKQLQYFDSALSAAFSLDTKRRIVACNKTAEKIIGLPCAQWLKKPVDKVFINDLTNIGTWMRVAYQQKVPQYRRFLVKRNGSERIWEIYLEFVRSRFGYNEGAILIINDVTAIIQSQRTATWLTVAQKLAHEIKNPLTTIRLTLQRLKYEYDAEPSLKERVGSFVEGSLEEVNRVRQVLDDFMHFSKLDRTEFYRLNMAHIVKEVVERYQNNLPSGVEIIMNIDEDLTFIQADGAQMSTLLTNLIDNALHAIKAPGEIEIFVRSVEKINPDRGNYLEEMVELEISDTGEGMEKDTLQKIFQPFFTTREGGSGLGMNIVKRIVNDHHGAIEIYSQKGLGTRVVIQFPIDKGEENTI